MPEDATLKITTAVDLSGLQSGMDSAKTVTAEGIAEMKIQYTQGTAAAGVAIKQLTDMQAALGPAAKAGSIQAAAALKVFEDEAKTAVVSQAALKAEIGAAERGYASTAAEAQALAEAEAESAAAAAAEAAALAEAAAAAEVAANAKRDLAAATTQARFSAQLLGRELGIPLPRALSSVAAKSEILGPLLANAFPIIGAAMLVELIATKVVPKIGEMIDAIGGWNAKTKEIYAEIEAENLKLYHSYEHVAEQIAHITNIGKTGSAAAAGTVAEVAASIARVNHELEINKKALADSEVAITKWMAPFDTAAHHLEEQALNNIPMYRAEIQRLTVELRDLSQIKLPTVKAEGNKDAVKETDDLAKARIEAAHKVADDEARARSENVRLLYDEHRITVDQQLQWEILANEMKLAADKEYYEARKALARREQSQTGKPAAPEIATLNADEAIAAQTTARANVQAHERAAKEIDQIYRKEIESAKEMEEAVTKIFGQLGGPIGEIAKDWERVSKEELEAAHKTLDEEGRLLQEQIRESKDAGDAILADAKRDDAEMLKMHQITVKTKTDLDIQAINSWYQAERAVLELSLTEARRIYGEQAVEYKKLIEKLKQLDRERTREVQLATNQEEQAWEKNYQKITNMVNRDLTEMLQHHLTFAKALEQAYNQMATQVILNIARWIEAEVLAELTHKALAQKSAVTDAKSAASSAFKWVMQEVPYPENVVLAPIAAVGAFAGVMAFAGSAERGGIVPINAHAGEMILPAHISRWVQNAAGEGKGNNGGSHSFHVAPTFVTTKDLTEADVQKHSRMIARTVQRELGRFNR